MELKDVILSTLAEMEEPLPQNSPQKSSDFEVIEKKELPQINTKTQELVKELQDSSPDNELMFLNSIRERLLVLFEGFQAPNNTNIEAKVDLTLNFLEYILATIDSRVENLQKGNKQ